MITMLTAVAELLTSFPYISTIANGRNHLRPAAISRTVSVEIQRQRHSHLAKEEVPTKDVTPIVATADIQKIKHSKPKALVRQPGKYGYGNALGYAQESGYGPSNLFFR